MYTLTRNICLRSRAFLIELSVFYSTKNVKLKTKQKKKVFCYSTTTTNYYQLMTSNHLDKILLQKTRNVRKGEPREMIVMRT